MSIGGPLQPPRPLRQIEPLPPVITGHEHDSGVDLPTFDYFRYRFPPYYDGWKLPHQTADESDG